MLFLQYGLAAISICLLSLILPRNRLKFMVRSLVVFLVISLPTLLLSLDLAHMGNTTTLIAIVLGTEFFAVIGGLALTGVDFSKLKLKELQLWLLRIRFKD